MPPPACRALTPFTNVAPAEWRKLNSVAVIVIDQGHISSPVAAEPMLHRRMRVESKNTANICTEAHGELSSYPRTEGMQSGLANLSLGMHQILPSGTVNQPRREEPLARGQYFRRRSRGIVKLISFASFCAIGLAVVAVVHA